jgi:hypothetical protein
MQQSRYLNWGKRDSLQTGRLGGAAAHVFLFYILHFQVAIGSGINDEFGSHHCELLSNVLTDVNTRAKTRESMVRKGESAMA